MLSCEEANGVTVLETTHAYSLFYYQGINNRIRVLFLKVVQFCFEVNCAMWSQLSHTKYKSQVLIGIFHISIEKYKKLCHFVDIYIYVYYVAHVN